MDRDELTLAIAGALTAAVLLGWVLHWLFARLARGSRASLDQVHDLVERLHAAETAREIAEHRAEDFRSRLAEAEAERDAALAGEAAAHARAEEVRDAYRAAMEERGFGRG